MNNKINKLIDDCRMDSGKTQESFTIITLIIENFVLKNNQNILTNFYGFSDQDLELSEADYLYLINELKVIIKIENKYSYLAAWALSKTNDTDIYNYLKLILEERYKQDVLLTKQILLGISSDYFKDSLSLLERMKKDVSDTDVIKIINDIQRVLKSL